MPKGLIGIDPKSLGGSQGVFGELDRILDKNVGVLEPGEMEKGCFKDLLGNGYVLSAFVG
ncbi:hypothetical protein OHB01_17980 [Microbispora hainanensis]|uniref:hypothetical protein n=1 Tax=Microbispora hainanensis TaxID=568844 RepID=UPI002E29F285|nr:hypothetical protein [Microbispora hainanensis]